MDEHLDCIGRNYDVILDSTVSDHGLDEMWFYQGDIGGTLTIFLHEAGLPMALPPDGKVMCFFERKDKNIVQRELTLLARSESKYVANIDNAILEVAGKVKCEVKVYHCENRTTFAQFEITSKKSMSIESGVDTPEKYDLIQTVLKHGIRLDGVDESLRLNSEAHEEFARNILAHQQALDNLSKLLTDTDTKLDNKVIEINKSITTLQTSFEQSLTLLANNVATDISNTNNSITELGNSTSATFNEFNQKILEFEKATGLKFEEVLQTYTNLSNATDQSFQAVNEYLDSLSINKVSIIESSEEPDTTNLPVGTLWIKPQVVQEEPQ